MEYRERAVRIFVHRDVGLDVVGARRALRKLQRAPLVGYRVIARDHPTLLDAQNVGEACGSRAGTNALPLICGGWRTARYAVADKSPDVAVGLRDVADAAQTQFLRQPPLSVPNMRSLRPRASGE